MKGCHVKGYNSHSIGVCYEGGHRDDPPQLSAGNLKDLAKIESGAANPPPKQGGRGVFEDNRTAEQMITLHFLLCTLHEMFPRARIVGHRDLPGVAKACPCFDAEKEYKYLLE